MEKRRNPFFPTETEPLMFEELDPEAEEAAAAGGGGRDGIEYRHEGAVCILVPVNP